MHQAYRECWIQNFLAYTLPKITSKPYPIQILKLRGELWRHAKNYLVVCWPIAKNRVLDF